MRKSPGLFCGFLLLLAAMASAAPCTPSATSLCLSAGRFEVSVAWKDFQSQTGVGQAVPLTADTGYFWFFSASNVELIVKVLDARALNGKFWVFFGALSNVEYTLTVWDSVTGSSKTYQNPSGQFASVGDTTAFDGASSGAAATHENVTVSGTPAAPASIAEVQAFLERAAPAARDFTPCIAGLTDLYLSGCRFKLQVSWQDTSGRTGDGQGVQLTDDTGYFWFFSDTNVELMAKVLDARSINGNFWVFFGALSNVQYRITVTDTLSGDVKVYTNPQGTFASVGDTTAFRPGPSISIVRDEVRATSGRFDDTGGALTATAADGTQFVLTLSPNSLALPVRITMTPLARVDGLPVSGPLVAAVQIEPDGLLLWGAASLKILPPAAPSLGSLTDFRFRGPGESFTPYPGIPQTTDIEIPVAYLAGYGVATGSPSVSAPAPSPLRAKQTQAAGSFDAYVGQAAALFRQLLQEAIDFQTYQTEVYAVWEEAWTTVVLPALEGIGNDCDPGRIRSALQMLEELLHLDPETDPRYWVYNSALNVFIKDAALRCIDEAYRRCKENNDPSEALLILNLQAILERAALISDAENQAIFDKIDRCLRFEIDFDSALTIQSGSVSERLKVRSIVPIRLEAAEHYILSGTSDIHYEFADVQGPPCTGSVETQPGVFEVERVDMGLFQATTVRDQNLTVDMVYLTGDPLEKVTWTCPLVGTETGTFESVFEPTYALFHQDEALGDRQFIVFRWQPVREGNFFAKLIYERSLTLGVVADSEETHIFLKHTPQ